MDQAEFEHIFVDREARTSALTRQIRKKLPRVPVTIVKDRERFLKESEQIPLSRGKRMLWLTVFKGPFLKPCPGTGKDYLCCRYWTLNAQTNCPLDCSYCILQTFLNFPLITIFVNVRGVLREIDRLLASRPGRLYRMGTGELTDSLALDPLTRLNGTLIRHCLSKKIVLEIKTKTDFVSHLPRVPKRNIVTSWSLNPEEVIKSEEHKASPLGARLDAARKALEKGYRLGFHFDPLILMPGWENRYERLVEKLIRAVPESEVFWISLGGFRFPPSLKAVMDERFPRTKIATGEFVKGMDGKMRYFRPARTEMFKKVYALLRKRWRNVFIYFCMENRAVWEEVMGFAPEDNSHLDFLFHQSIARRFPELRLQAPDRKDYQAGD